MMIGITSAAMVAVSELASAPLAAAFVGFDAELYKMTSAWIPSVCTVLYFLRAEYLRLRLFHSPVQRSGLRVYLLYAVLPPTGRYGIGDAIDLRYRRYLERRCGGGRHRSGHLRDPVAGKAKELWVLNKKEVWIPKDIHTSFDYYCGSRSISRKARDRGRQANRIERPANRSAHRPPKRAPNTKRRMTE